VGGWWEVIGGGCGCGSYRKPPEEIRICSIRHGTWKIRVLALAFGVPRFVLTLSLGHDIDRGVSIWELAFAFWRYQLIELAGPNPLERR